MMLENRWNAKNVKNDKNMASEDRFLESFLCLPYAFHKRFRFYKKTFSNIDIF